MISDETREKWVAALRSGDYEQTTGVLKSNEGKFCCIGVLCDLADEYKWSSGGSQNCHYMISPESGYTFESELEEEDLAHFNLSHDAQRLLIDLNDTKKAPFSEIADVIEKGTAKFECEPETVTPVRI